MAKKVIGVVGGGESAAVVTQVLETVLLMGATQVWFLDMQVVDGCPMRHHLNDGVCPIVNLDVPSWFAGNSNL